MGITNGFIIDDRVPFWLENYDDLQIYLETNGIKTYLLSEVIKGEHAKPIEKPVIRKESK